MPRARKGEATISGQFGGTCRRTDHPVCAASPLAVGAATPPLRGGEWTPTQNIYFSANCISRMLVRVVLILPKVWEVKLKSGLPQFGWFGRLNASNRNWSE